MFMGYRQEKVVENEIVPDLTPDLTLIRVTWQVRSFHESKQNIWYRTELSEDSVLINRRLRFASFWRSEVGVQTNGF